MQSRQVFKLEESTRGDAFVAEPNEPVGMSATAVDSSPATWFYGPRFDLLIGCGLWSAPLLLFAYYCSANYPQGISIAFYALALVFNYPHYMATIYRAYRTHEDFVKYKIFTLHLTLLIALLIILSHANYRLLAVVFTLYLTWSPFHYTGQNFGIALLFARRNGVKTSRESRLMFYIAFLAPYVMFFLAVHSFSATDQFILSLGIPLKVARILWVVMLFTFVVSAISSLSAFVRQTGWRAMTAPIALLSTQVAWFVVPTALTLFSNIDFLQARSTAGILAVMHSIQYLWITSYYARRESQASQVHDAPRQKNHWRGFAYFAVLVVGGIALFVPGPWLASRVLHMDFSASFLAFTALINIHHFLLDGAIWKLRDGRIAALLINTSQRIESRGTGDSRFNQLIRWLISPQWPARVFRVSATIVLLLIAGMDQAKFYYGAQASDAASLRRAEQLNPYDAGLQLRLARANERDGNQSANQSALEAAVRVNPSYRLAQVALARQLIESGRYEAAYTHYEQMFLHLPPDVDSLVNFGLLASQLGHQEEAINAWQRALELDSNQANAHLYLADALARKKQFKDAIPHYEQYLGLVATQTSLADGSGPIPHPAVLVKVVVQLASACEAVGDYEAAARFSSQATGLAEKAGDRSGLILALVNSADINTKHGRTVEALADFQRALILENTSSAAGQADHWFKYGKFLQQARVSPRLVFACFVKAEVLLKGDDHIEGRVVRDLAEPIKKELSATAAALDTSTIDSIKTNLTPVLQEALVLKL